MTSRDMRLQRQPLHRRMQRRGVEWASHGLFYLLNGPWYSASMFPARADYTSPTGGSAWYRIQLPEGERITSSRWDVLVRRFQSRFLALMAGWPYDHFLFNPWTATGQPRWRAVTGLTYRDAWHSVGSVENGGLFDQATLDALGFLFTMLPESFPGRDDTIWRLWHERQLNSISADTVRDMVWATDFLQSPHPNMPTFSGVAPTSPRTAIDVPADALMPRYNVRLPITEDSGFFDRFDPLRGVPTLPPSVSSHAAPTPSPPVPASQQLPQPTTTRASMDPVLAIGSVSLLALGAWWLYARSA